MKASFAADGNAVKVAATKASDVLHKESRAAKAIMLPTASARSSASGMITCWFTLVLKSVATAAPRTKKTVTSRKSPVAARTAAADFSFPLRTSG